MKKDCQRSAAFPLTPYQALLHVNHWAILSYTPRQLKEQGSFAFATSPWRDGFFSQYSPLHRHCAVLSVLFFSNMIFGKLIVLEIDELILWRLTTIQRLTFTIIKTLVTLSVFQNPGLFPLLTEHQNNWNWRLSDEVEMTSQIRSIGAIINAKWWLAYRYLEAACYFYNLRHGGSDADPRMPFPIRETPI